MTLKRLGDVKEMNYGPKPEGAYQVQIITAKKGYTKAKHSPYLNIDSVIVDGEHKGGHLFWTVWTSEKAFGFLKPFLLASGFSDDDEINVENGEIMIDETDLSGRQLVAIVSGHETYDKVVDIERGITEKRTKEIVTMFRKVETKIPFVMEEDIPF